MFFVTGAVLVTCGTFIVVYNADVILPAVAALGNRFGRIVPAVKTAIAYPLTARFRTGLTIAMIGLIMFVLSLQAAVDSNFAAALSGADARGDFDVQVLMNGNNRVDDFPAALEVANRDPDARTPADPASIDAVGEARTAQWFEVDIEDPEWQLEDPAERDPENQFKHFLLMGVDSGFIEAQDLPLQYRAAGYETDAEVWQALRSNPQFAIIPSSLTADGGGFGDAEGEDLLDLPNDLTSDDFEPFQLNVRNRSTGAITTLTVIGQTKDSAFTFWPGIIVQKEFVLETFPASEGQAFFLRLKPGVNAEDYARRVESVLVQASAESLADVIDEQNAQNRTFLQLFQGYLGLGLIVGIAALGVISLRAVVERRQQIGMLRAIGYKRTMVQLSFLFEAGFIALAGILLGLGLGLSFAWNLFTSGEFGETAEGSTFTVPWVQVAVMTAIAFVAAMVMTYLPARAASRVAVAEALRYE
jgi:putative ABC transport system permease protein